MAGEKAHHVVIAAAAPAGNAKFGHADFKNRARVVGHSPDQGRVEYQGKIGGSHGADGRLNLLQGGADFVIILVAENFLQNGQALGNLRHPVQFLEEVRVPVDSLCRISGFLEFSFHALEADFVHLVENNENLVEVLFGKTGIGRHFLQDPPLVDVDRKALKANISKCCGRCGDELDFRQIRRLAQDIDVALGELAVAAPLGTVRAEHGSDLQGLEGLRQVVFIVRIETGKGNGQVVAHAVVDDVGLGLSRIQMELLAPL